MGVMEIVLLVAGGVIAILSFVLPVRKEEVSEGTRDLAKEEIKNLVAKEMDAIRGHVDDVVDEAIGYAVEKTERSLERLTNEKIMAVHEYSDTVLQEIRRNHEETMFLYDMLNDKHANLKNTVSEVNKTVQEVEETKKEAEAMVSSFQQLIPEPAAWSEKVLRTPEVPETPVLTGIDRISAMARAQKKAVQPAAPAAPAVPAAPVKLDAISERTEQQGGNKERILELYKQGKSKVAIAKELGLGVGEVKLIIDLYKNT